MTGIRPLRRFLQKFTPLIAVAGLSCADPSGPSKAGQVYVLDRVGPDSLPAVYYSDDTFLVRMLADTLRLFEDGSGTRTSLLEYEVLPGGSGTPGEVPVASEFTYELKHWRLEIVFECADTGACIAPPHFIARLSSGELRVEYALGGRVPLIYRVVKD